MSTAAGRSRAAGPSASPTRVEHVAEQPDETSARRGEMSGQDNERHGYSLPLQFGDLPLELRDLALEPVEPALRGGPGCHRRGGAARRRAPPARPRVLAQPVPVALLLLPRPAGVARDEPRARSGSRASSRARLVGERVAGGRPALRSSPGVCGPRSIRTASSACSGAPARVSSSRWRSCAARAPLAKRVQRRRASRCRRRGSSPRRTGRRGRGWSTGCTLRRSALRLSG